MCVCVCVCVCTQLDNGNNVIKIIVKLMKCCCLITSIKLSCDDNSIPVVFYIHLFFFQGETLLVNFVL